MNNIEDKIQQQIEAYLNQDMNDFERSKFEKQIHDNDELHDEVELQQATLEAIRNERMLALKAGLNNVNISLWSATVLETVKVAAIAACVGLSAIGWYYYSSPETSNVERGVSFREESISPNLKLNESTNSAEATIAIEDIEQSKSSNSSQAFQANPSNGDAPISSSKPQRRAQSVKNDKQIILDPSVGTRKSNEVLDVDLIEPKLKTVNPLNAKDIALPEDGISSKSSLQTVNPEIVIKKENKDKFHYQFSDSKLILYADFSEGIYEILELNQDNSKKMFLTYNGKYYSLDADQLDITPLVVVQDKGLIQLLDAYLKRK